VITFGVKAKSTILTAVLPVGWVTVAVNVTDWPTVEGLGAEVRVVVMAAELTAASLATALAGLLAPNAEVANSKDGKAFSKSRQTQKTKLKVRADSL